MTDQEKTKDVEAKDVENDSSNEENNEEKVDRKNMSIKERLEDGGKKPTAAELKKDYEKRLAQYNKEVAMPRDPRFPNYVGHGSSKHASHLGLEPDLPSKDNDWRMWKLIDPWRWGQNAQPGFINSRLDAKINSLTAPMPETQSEDPLAPNYAKPMFSPSTEQEIKGLHNEVRDFFSGR